MEKEISTGTSGETIYIAGAKAQEGDEVITGTGDGVTYTAILHRGTVTQGDKVTEYNGVALDVFSQGTWSAMTAEQYNSNTWYTYADSELINIDNSASAAEDFGMKDLFYTHSLHFVAETAVQDIELSDNVDLGVGYMQYSLAEGQAAATFNLGKNSSDKALSTAGFIVDKGVTLNNHLTYGAGRELRRVGEGTMNMVGTGDNNVLLNIGGGGLTHLARENGYAAYNVFVGTGATLSLSDIGQVKHNVTLGAGGGTLELNGNDYNWAATEGNADGHFSLTVYEGLNRVETAAIANLAEGTSSTLTISREGDFEFAGAFRDGSTYTGSGSLEQDSRHTMMPGELINKYTQYTADQRQDSSSVLKVIYNGGGTMMMTGVYTILTGSNGQERSGLEVANGRVLLQGTNTIHALGSEDGTNTNRYQNANDWHYAMAEMGVVVQSGASFELGHHALLMGDVSVASGGSYVMKQAVNERHECVEGWYTAEDTSALADYYGHKGNVSLEAGATMAVRFDAGVATSLSYGGNISGEGSLVVEAGNGSVYLSGQNSFSGEKTLASGQLHLAAGAEGDVSSHQWLVGEQGSLVLENLSSNSDVLRLVDASSTGVLALSQDMGEALGGSEVPGLIIGAAEGSTVHYGSSETLLASVGNQWTLGGGGGTLVVDFLLADNADGTANKLVLGNEFGSGVVLLNNAGNSFSGGIEIVGNVSLEYSSEAALGSGGISVGYGHVLSVENAAFLSSGALHQASAGAFCLTEDQSAGGVDLSNYSSLAIAAAGEMTLSGPLTVAEGAAYRFGGSGTLTVDTALSGAHDMVVDGQANPASTVILAQASTATGSVLVQGYDASYKLTEGKVTLALAAENALATASGVTVQNGGVLELGGLNQTLANLSGNGSASIQDAVGGNTLTLHNSEDSSYAGSVFAAGTKVLKTGTGTLTLAGSNKLGSITVNEGTLAYNAGSNEALCAVSGEGTFALVGGSATADLSSNLKVGKLVIDGASLTYDSLGAIATGHNIEIVGSDSSLSLAKWSNLNASAIVLRDGGIIRSGDNGFGNNEGTVYVDGSGTIEYGNTGGGNVAASVSGTGTLNVRDWNSGLWVTFNGTISDGEGGQLALNLHQNKVTLGAANTYSGGTIISGGQVIIANADALGTGGVTLKGGTLSAETALNVKSPMTFSGTGDMRVTGTLNLSTPAGSSFVYSGTGAAVVEADIANSANRMGITVASANKGADFVELTLSGTIGTSATSFGIDKDGAGTLKLTGSNKFAWGFNINAGRVIAASDVALGVGSVTVANQAVLEIDGGTHALVHHYINMAGGSELLVHALSTETAALATDGTSITQWDSHSSLGALTLTLAEDISLASGTGYKVISLENGSTLASGVTANDMQVNYLGNGRFSFTTRFESNTLYLDATQAANTTLVWNGSAENATWNQAAQNANWSNEAGTEDSSFMNQDSVRFTEAAANKKIAVDAAGVQVQSMEVSGAGYSFSGGSVQANAASMKEMMQLEDGASLKLGEGFTMSQVNAEAGAASIGPVDMSATSIHGLQEGGLAVLDNTLIDVAKGASLELKDVLLTATSRITDDPATVSMENVTLTLAAANTLLEGATTLGSATPLVQAGGEASFSLDEGTRVYALFSSALDTVTVTGSSLTLDLSGLVADWQGCAYLALRFGLTEGTLAHFDTTAGLSISATLDGTTCLPVYVAQGEADSASTLYIAAPTQAVPEPTTATLSLLALSLLAARRRRAGQTA